MKYDIEAIRTRVNSMVADLKKACENEDWATVESILCSPLYDEDDIPRVKQMYQVTLKRVLTNTVYVKAYDEDDAIAQAEVKHVERHCNYNEWDFDGDLESEVELVEEE